MGFISEITEEIVRKEYEEKITALEQLLRKAQVWMAREPRGTELGDFIRLRREIDAALSEKGEK